jgi:hypothetical protein
MPVWPPLSEPELLRRLTLDDAQFAAFIRGVVGQLPSRECDDDTIARAIAYPWARPLGSYLVAGEELEMLEAMSPERREDVLDRLTAAGGDRLPVLSIGSNAAPETLRRKFAHFTAAADRTVLALTGRLHDFDVGVAAQPTMYGSMPATLFPSAGTAVAATLLWVTPAQFTQLAWSEITYRLGRLRTGFAVEETAAVFDEVLVFVSRFGAFCPDGEPAALAAIPASGRSAPELSQGQLLDLAAQLAIGPEARAETLIRAIFEDPGQVLPRLAKTVNRAALPFSSERWTPLPAPGRV